MVPFTPLYIDGQEVPSSNKATFEVINPASGKIVGQSASASGEDCSTAVESAAKAFTTWQQSGIAERRAIFLKAAEIVSTETYKKKIVQATQDETAAVDYWSTLNWAGAGTLLRTAAGFLNELGGKTLPSALPGGKLETQRRPMGVILAIAPWNAPFTLTLRAVAIPIICGNTVVVKSSEYSPRSQAIVAELFREAGLPNGVLNCLSMSKEVAPAMTAELIANPKVRKINFTGSDRVGRIIAIEAAKYLKPCVLELGGKAPVVVLDDADVTQAAKAIVFGSMVHSGQVCMSTERVIVQTGIADSLITLVRDSAKALKAGDPKIDAATKLSAVFSEASADNILSMIREAIEAGADLILGDLGRDGNVIQPHLLSGVKSGMRLWDRESFGPVVVFCVVDNIDEAIEMANASEYSLTAAVWTSNMYSAQRVSSSIRAGITHINGPTTHTEPLLGSMGLGGASGYGRFDIDNFTDIRGIVTHPLDREYFL
ncbi:Salicylaldehyde dehydrogenase [Hypsizygus marmoreus]|uniref:Salicylaldehyde dehydrogenase n=1 Tax=Hypsizygus marmoreus TaxID=39966 RepID=A0A369JDL7_HYPMA|nr:Salicylaldehyde dehydrogenase [Hypsizygus marmoreus]